MVIVWERATHPLQAVGKGSQEENLNMNIMIVTNSAYLSYAYTMLHSLFRSHPGEPMRICLPYEDLRKEELIKLGEFCERHGSVLLPLYVGTEFKEKVQSRNGINVETYYRILAMDLLPSDMERILYLDVDMIIRGSLRPLYDADLSGKAFAVCEDIFGKINGFHEANKYRMGIPKEYSYFNAGVMLYHLSYLREVNACSALLERVYKDYERYEYNYQDVMNEMFYDRLLFAGWDQYNCPPAWYYMDQAALAEGRVVFADYDTIREYASSRGEEELSKRYLNVTKQIYDNARVIHYLGDTKPWSKTRKDAAVYSIFDRAYEETVNELGGI